MGRRDIATGVIIIREKPISDQNMRGVKTVSRLFFVQAISGYEDNLLSGECDIVSRLNSMLLITNYE